MPYVWIWWAILVEFFCMKTYLYAAGIKPLTFWLKEYPVYPLIYDSTESKEHFSQKTILWGCGGSIVRVCCLWKGKKKDLTQGFTTQHANVSLGRTIKPGRPCQMCLRSLYITECSVESHCSVNKMRKARYLLINMFRKMDECTRI